MKRLLFFIICVHLLQTVSGQEYAPQDIPTPNAMSLGKYGDIPVSYYTGTANIEIPLHTLSVKGVELPLSLTYDTSGLLINSLPSWTGMNWTLQAGGVIVRQRRGYYDEHVLPQHVAYNYTRYFDNYDKILEIVSDGSSNHAVMRSTNTSFQDLEPDIFTFSFMGKSGKFFLGNDGQWKVYSKENLEVIFDIANSDNYISPFFPGYPKSGYGAQPKVIKGFKIRDENGIVYTFGGDNHTIEYTTSFFDMSDEEEVISWYPVSWYLKRISDRHGNTLYDLTYERGKYIIQVYNYWQYMEKSGTFNWPIFLGAGNVHHSYYYSSFDQTFPYGFSVSSPVYLNKIVASNGVEVDFTSVQTLTGDQLYPQLYTEYPGDRLYEYMARRVSKWVSKYDPDAGMSGPFFNYPGAFYYLQLDYTDYDNNYYTVPNSSRTNILSYTGIRQLVRISIHGIGKCQKNYTFQYNYNKRLFLNSLLLSGNPQYENGQSAVGCYKFSYYNPQALPASYLTRAADHWGYYNGSEYLYPSGYNAYSFKPQRDPNGGCCKYGMLTEIVYPTGGTSVIEYEPHTFSKRLSLDRQTLKDSVGIAGGVRVKSITEYDDESHSKILKKRSFVYNKPNTTLSSGELFSPPVYNWSDYLLKDGGYDANYTLRLFRSTSIFPLSNSFGPHIGYSCVEEMFEDGSKTRYQYSGLSDNINRDMLYDITLSNVNVLAPDCQFSERGFMRGCLLLTTMYDANGQKVKATGLRYRDSGLEKYIYASDHMQLSGGGSGSLAFFTGGVYRIYYPKNDVEERIDTLFYPNGIFISSTQFGKVDRLLAMTSPYIHQADARLLTSVSISTPSETQMAYYSYADENSSTADGKTISQNYYLQPLHTYQYKDSTLLWQHTIHYQTRTRYIPSIGSLQCFVPDYEIRKNADNSIDTLIIYKDYSDKMELCKYKELGGKDTWLKWSPRYGFLMMKGLGNYIPDYVTSPTLPGIMEPDQEGWLTVLQNATALSDSFLTGYTYDPLGGVTAIVKPTGETIYYEYDWFGNLSNIYDTNHVLLQHFDYNYKNKTIN